ncbi:DUF4176 domain-containing protein [Bacillus vallismortis]|uniref:DUF4176 domain-containing protein n=1 Tax=Bacillus vallismortis TaxID=72361 RepID=UPI00227DA460|nr:DUF4176 domain-containing protein [Bacillus vallismortis]MCY7919616.1 DUF4176 domain-containing protein [Bacillus vallismortis]
MLPIGSVVKIINVRKIIMIYGRNQLQTSSQKKVRLCFSSYPEGNINENYNLFFNHDMIEEVLFEGYQTQEEHALQEAFKG